MATAIAIEPAPLKADQQQAEAAQEMFKIVSGFWLSRCVQVAATLGVADHVDDEGAYIWDLARKTNTDPSALYRVLRALSSNGIFREHEGRRFTATPMSNTLRKDAPGSLRASLMCELGLVHYASWRQLIDSVRTGEIAFNRVHGMDVWEYFDGDPEMGALFNESMTHITEAIERAVLAVYDFSRYRTIVDVGGGQGRLLAAMLGAAPQARGILVDRRRVIAQAREHLAEHPAGGRIDLAEGDFFHSVPAGADLYTLKWIIHDWAEPEALCILANVRAAMAPHARVLLLETVIPEPNTPHFAPMMDVNMLVMTGGRERRAGEYAELFAKAGLRLTNVYPTESPVSVIEAVAA